jgi:hypothetical protein
MLNVEKRRIAECRKISKNGRRKEWIKAGSNRC